MRDETGDARVPSVIFFPPGGTVVVGAQARARWVADPTHTAYSVKRLIGRTLADLKADLEFVPYQIVERATSDGRPVLHVRIEEQEHTPELLSSLVLQEVVRRADLQLGRKVRRAVITVPAYFDETQRQATRDAGRLAGLDVVRIVNEPTAAALAYGLGTRKEGLIAVYDFGGGTFDCSILQVDSGIFKVLSTHGDTHLGGDDVDRALMEEVARRRGLGLEELSPTKKQELRDACEELKITLSTESAGQLRLELGATSREETWTREEFERLIGPIVDRTIASCRSALRDAAVEPRQIDEVVMVGGSSRIPLVRERVEKLFGRRPHIEINPDEVVAAGAAVQGVSWRGRPAMSFCLTSLRCLWGSRRWGGR